LKGGFQGSPEVALLVQIVAVNGDIDIGAWIEAARMHERAEQVDRANGRVRWRDPFHSAPHECVPLLAQHLTALPPQLLPSGVILPGLVNCSHLSLPWR
jgi:hypothetical protein